MTNHIIIKHAYLIVLLWLLISCNKEEKYQYPLIFTGDISKIDSSGATFTANITDLGNEPIIEYGFVWDENTNPTTSSEKHTIQNKPKEGVISERISTTLKKGAKYHVRAFVRSNNYITYGKEKTFTSLGNIGPKITDFDPKSAVTGSIIKLIGTGFSSIPKNNKITIGGFDVEVIKASPMELEVLLPKQEKIIYPSRNVIITVDVCGIKRTYSNTLLIKDHWFRLFCPIPSSYSAKCFVINNKAYIISNNYEFFWEYDPSISKWTKLMNFPLQGGYRGKGFIIGNKIFYGMVYNHEWWEYDIKFNTWSRKNDFPFEVAMPSSFQIDSVGFLGINSIYQNSGIYQYNSKDDIWIKVSDYPQNNQGQYFTITNSDYALIGLAQNYSSPCMYKYTPSTNTWKRISNFTNGINELSGAVGFNYKGNIYVKTFSSKEFLRYEEDSDSWIEFKTEMCYNPSGGIAFCIGNKAFVGLGASNEMWVYEF